MKAISTFLLDLDVIVRISFLFAVVFLCLTTPANADDWQRAQPPNPVSKSDWRVGGYFGALSRDALSDIVVRRPWATRWQSDYLVDLHAIYTLHRFSSIPLDLELEFGGAKRFGQSNEWEVDLIPMARWRWLPWNDFIYTNIRLGLLGASYASGVSDWEKLNTRNHTGSNFLNFLVPEITFAPSADSNLEAYIRVHHRSGIYGLINGVSGGSNYVSVGVRSTLP